MRRCEPGSEPPSLNSKEEIPTDIVLKPAECMACSPLVFPGKRALRGGSDIFRHPRKESFLIAQSFAEGLWTSGTAAVHVTEQEPLKNIPLWYQGCSYPSVPEHQLHDTLSLPFI